MPLILGTNSIKETGYDVANSLRLNQSDDPFLKRIIGTPTSNRKFSVSCWVKLSKLGVQRNLWGLGATSGATGLSVRFQDDDTIDFFDYNGSGNNFGYSTNQVFRDPTAWSHFLFAVDTEQSTAHNRVRIYHNGTEIEKTNLTDNPGDPSEDANLTISSGHTFKVGDDNAGSNEWDGYIAEFVYIDGLQLTPSSFGQFNDDTPTVWEPIDVTGLTFGNNGFYLDFEKDETSTNFIDRSPSARAITVSGNVHHSLDQAKFNDSSIEFDGSGDNLQVADSSDFDFGTGDFTFELFVYKQTSGKMSVFETRTYSGSGGEGFNLEFSSADKFEWYDGSLTSGLPGDPSAISLNTWVHYAVVRYNNVCTMYKNGTSVGTPKDVGSASQNSTRGPIIGEVANGDNDFDGYMDEIRLSNVARYTGNFTAPTSPFTSDSNTVLLIQSNASNKIGADVSGQGNHFESHGITSEDQSTDTCTNNFATLNPLVVIGSTGQNYEEGNLTFGASGTNWTHTNSTIGASQGKWYAEFRIDTLQSSTGYGNLGITSTENITNGPWLSTEANSAGVGLDHRTGQSDIRSAASVVTSNMGDFSNGDIVGLAVDMDNKALYIHKAGTYYQISGVTGVPTSGSSKTGAVTIPAGIETFVFAIGGYSTDFKGTFNFGSPPYSISSGNADANGYGNFEYAVPSGFYSLNTKNLAEFG